MILAKEPKFQRGVKDLKRIMSRVGIKIRRATIKDCNKKTLLKNGSLSVLKSNGLT